MTKKQLFKHLKNGKNVWISWPQKDDDTIKVNLSFSNQQFIFYSYCFNGNDEWDTEDKSQLMNVTKFYFPDFDSLTNELDNRYPDWVEFLPKPKLIIEAVYTKPDKYVPGYLEVLFGTNQGFFKVGVCSFQRTHEYNLNEYEKDDISELKSIYGELLISEMRITNDNDKYFLISDSFLLVLGYRLTSELDYGVNAFWVIEDLNGANKSELESFYEMERLNLIE